MSCAIVIILKCIYFLFKHIYLFIYIYPVIDPPLYVNGLFRTMTPCQYFTELYSKKGEMFFFLVSLGCVLVKITPEIIYWKDYGG